MSVCMALPRAYILPKDATSGLQCCRLAFSRVNTEQKMYKPSLMFVPIVHRLNYQSCANAHSSYILHTTLVHKRAVYCTKFAAAA